MYILDELSFIFSCFYLILMSRCVLDNVGVFGSSIYVIIMTPFRSCTIISHEQPFATGKPIVQALLGVGLVQFIAILFQQCECKCVLGSNKRAPAHQTFSFI